MHDTHDAHGAQAMDEMTEQFIRFYRKYYRDELGRLAQRYPSEQRALRIDYSNLVQFEAELAEGWLDTPEQMHEYADAALHNVDLPADVSLTRDDAPPAEVRLTNLPEDREYYPGGYSPSDAPGEYVAIRGEIAMATDTYPKIVDAAFECQRCGTMTYIPQDDGYQEPHECQGCERQGPFHIDFDRSVFVDAQSLRVQEPPSVAGGEGATVDVFVEEDLAGRADTGDFAGEAAGAVADTIGGALGPAIGTVIGDALSNATSGDVSGSVSLTKPQWVPLRVAQPDWAPLEVESVEPIPVDAPESIPVTVDTPRQRQPPTTPPNSTESEKTLLGNIGKGVTRGAAAGAVTGTAAGFLGGPLAPVSVPGGAIAGTAVGGAVGGGLGAVDYAASELTAGQQQRQPRTSITNEISITNRPRYEVRVDGLDRDEIRRAIEEAQRDNLAELDSRLDEVERELDRIRRSNKQSA
ncbi:hypothetical protein D3D02_00195 [Halobellus sp. Atlit-38R]|uniref:minichromosome maintenance protein MCM n=1 Tax=Halobellus sp. Atlit-38R TaxID=2282131 RepID=UPI000EF1F423|nr:minichromosome maintenance protein MCM [Halobellus sp. Atlit-38R]RLM94446.1 hypothetical protein D3D02_00195 [Halobellus sp. Atlit-38R]